MNIPDSSNNLISDVDNSLLDYASSRHAIDDLTIRWPSGVVVTLVLLNR